MEPKWTGKKFSFRPATFILLRSCKVQFVIKLKVNAIDSVLICIFEFHCWRLGCPLGLQVLGEICATRSCVFAFCIFKVQTSCDTISFYGDFFKNSRTPRMTSKWFISKGDQLTLRESDISYWNLSSTIIISHI